MRVIGGRYRGKKLIPPAADAAVRPTADRVKEALFNILQAVIPSASVLDLFSGSGALGIEALSRGAAKVVFADQDTSLTKRNLAAVGETANVLSGDYRALLGKLAGSGERFDVIFLDPPYSSALGEDALRLIAAHGLLADGGVAVYEHLPARAAELAGTGLVARNERVYGKTALTFIGRETP